jgi:hypothetical protein
MEGDDNHFDFGIPPGCVGKTLKVVATDEQGNRTETLVTVTP